MFAMPGSRAGSGIGALARFLALIGILPVGSVVAYGGSTAPRCWAFLDGSNKSRRVNKKLFAVYGTTYGVGDGSTTFGLPDARGRSIFGFDAANATGRLTNPGTTIGGLSASALGNTGGEQTHATVLAENGPHTHNVSGLMTVQTGVNNRNVAGAANLNTNDTITSTNSGSGTGHNNVPPGIVLNLIVYMGEP